MGAAALKEKTMADPKETERRKTEFNPASLEEAGKTQNKAVSSKRIDEEHGKVERPARSTRAARPRSGRSGSDSNASRRTRGG
jgi:hypothetical protein